MKRGIIALSMLACIHAGAQDISQYTPGEGEGIVYFLPKTALQLNIIATKVTYQPGDFCQYANRYLRINNVSAQPETHWELKVIDVRPVGVPDSTKVYIMKLKDKNASSNVELTENGLIKAINTTAPAEEAPAAYPLDKSAAPENARKYMTEDILMAGSTAKMAELTAKEIYNIRDSRNSIVRGQADNMPKDGASLKLVIDDLNKQEKAMTEMFTGHVSREDKLITLTVVPQDGMNEKVVARFSTLLGVLPADDLAGDPVYMAIRSNTPVPAPLPDDGKRKKKIEGVIYNVPGKGNVSVSYKGKNYFDGDLTLTQFGNTEVLTNGLFDKKVNTRVVFNPQTGGVVKIDKDQ